MQHQLLDDQRIVRPTIHLGAEGVSEVIRTLARDLDLRARPLKMAVTE